MKTLRRGINLIWHKKSDVTGSIPISLPVLGHASLSYDKRWDHTKCKSANRAAGKLTWDHWLPCCQRRAASANRLLLWLEQDSDAVPPYTQGLQSARVHPSVLSSLIISTTFIIIALLLVFKERTVTQFTHSQTHTGSAGMDSTFHL